MEAGSLEQFDTLYHILIKIILDFYLYPKQWNVDSNWQDLARGRDSLINYPNLEMVNEITDKIGCVNGFICQHLAYGPSSVHTSIGPPWP